VVDLEPALEEASSAGDRLVDAVAHEPEVRPSLAAQVPADVADAHASALAPERALHRREHQVVCDQVEAARQQPMRLGQSHGPHPVTAR
jgi:hypothetical protein